MGHVYPNVTVKSDNGNGWMTVTYKNVKYVVVEPSGVLSISDESGATCARYAAGRWIWARNAFGEDKSEKTSS